MKKLDGMKKQTLVIPGKLPGLNEIINSSKIGRGRFNAYGRLKKKWSGIIAIYARMSGLAPIHSPAQFVFTWTEPNRRRDPDNIASGGRKLILDTLVELGILDGDGWKHVAGWFDNFEIDKKHEGVKVEIYGDSRQNI